MENIPRHTYEIIKGDRYTKVINYDARINKPDFESLMEHLSNGFPQHWENYPIIFNNGWSVLKNIFVDNITNPNFFGKIKNNSHGRMIYQVDDVSELQFSKRLNSVLNEFELAPIVKRAIRDSASQKAAQYYGFNGIRFIEPLVGLIDHIHGYKSVFYKWNHATPLTHTSEYENVSEYFDYFTNRLGGILNRYGVEPFDMHSLQFMLDDKKRLILTDIEAYQRIKTS